MILASARTKRSCPGNQNKRLCRGMRCKSDRTCMGGVKMGAGGETVAVGRWRERRGSINDDDKWLSQWCSQWCILEYACLTVPW